MRNKLLVLVALMIMVLCSMAFAKETIKMGVNITDETYKEKYNKGDKVVVNVTIDEDCKELGLVMGAIEFDEKALSVKKCTGLGLEVMEDGEVAGAVAPKYFDEGLNNYSNQIIFWIEDQYNEIPSGCMGVVTFETLKAISASDLKFSFINVEASDYNLKNKYDFEQSSSNVTTEISKQTQKEKEEMNDQLADIKEKVEEDNSKKLEFILDTIEKNDENETKKNENSSSSTTSGKSNTKDTTIVTDAKQKDSNSSSTKDTSKESNKNDSITWSKSSNWSAKELQEANSKNLIPETLNGMDYTISITRKHFAAVVVKLYEGLSNKVAEASKENPFTDTADDYVLKAYNLGITNGTTKTTFSPESEITREQMATMIYRTLEVAKIDTKVDLKNSQKFVDENEMHTWSKDAIYFMAEKEIIKGISSKENKFGVKNNASIEQAIAISLRCKNTF